MKKEISPSGSLKGYKFKEFCVRTKGTFKVFLMAVVAVLLFFIPQIRSVEMSAAVATAGAAFTKWIADLIDFWLTDVEIKK